MASVGKPLPWSLREAIQRLLADGNKVAEVARQLGVSRPTVYRYGGKCLHNRLDGTRPELD